MLFAWYCAVIYGCELLYFLVISFMGCVRNYWSWSVFVSSECLVIHVFLLFWSLHAVPYNFSEPVEEDLLGGFCSCLIFIARLIPTRTLVLYISILLLRL